MNQNFIDLLKLFNEEKVEYLLVGGYAVSAHIEARATKDIDICINPSKENSVKVFSALAKFGAPLKGLKPEDFTDKESFYKMGLEPQRIDVLMDLSPLSFEDCWKRKISTKFLGTEVHLISLEDLITNKKSAGRPQDLVDAQNLEESGKIIKGK